MRIEELQNNLYIKSTDTVEKYLLNIIQEYFKNSNEAIEGSKEYIIREAVNRLKSEMDYNALGVLSVTLPNGEVRTGDIQLTLDDLNGEPLISPKLSAFNVNFGDTVGTACEGNDPRLSDARKPIKHEHEISDIKGLAGLLSTIDGKISRNIALGHEHSNKTVLDILTYSGNKNKIDLTVIDTLEPKIDQITNQIRQNIIQYIQDTETEIDNINAEITNVNQRVDEIKQYVIEQCNNYLSIAKQYTDGKFNQQSQDSIINYIDTNFVKKESIADLIDSLKSCYTLVNTESWLIQNLVLQTNQNSRIVNLPLSQTTKDELTKRSIDFNNSTEIIFNFSLEYTSGNKTIKQPLPHLDTFNNAFAPFMYPLITQLNLAGYIEAIQTNKNVLQVAFKNNENQLSQEMLNGKLVCDIYAKAFCPVYY